MESTDLYPYLTGRENLRHTARLFGVDGGRVEELLEREWDALAWGLRLDFAGLLVPIHVARGRLDEAREILRHVPTERRAESQERASIAIGRQRSMSTACTTGRRLSAIATRWRVLPISHQRSRRIISW